MNVTKVDIDTIVGLLQEWQDSSYWADRLLRELQFAHKLCSQQSSLSTEPLQKAAGLIQKGFGSDGILTISVAENAEKQLAAYRKEAKSFVVDCVGHAHLDMNWMWGYHETVSIVLDTLETMLKLMEEYPEFTFAQSQASIYKIVADHKPEMLADIRRRVHEGRWEVTATAWTEFDKNLSGSESQLRQYLYAQQYISELLGIDKDDLTVGFEPDTFGHHQRIPDVLTQAGLSYYYHCRGDVDHTMYRWKGPDGSEVLVYREPNWYLGPTVSGAKDPSQGTMRALQMDMAEQVLQLYREYGVRRVLQLYGVGDHGGGATRMDIEGLLDMQSWPCYPDIQFSTIGRFFSHLEEYRDKYPVVRGEINSIFTGCYTSQSLIKRDNHESEKMLYEAEFYSAAAGDPTSQRLQYSWQKVLFNQFHDILPGSCTFNSKAYALGQYQECFAEANTIRTEALRTLAHSIDTSQLPVSPQPGQRAFGAGVGYRTECYTAVPLGTVEGAHRAVTLFNAENLQRKQVAEVVLWDWEDSRSTIVCHDHLGTEVPVIIERVENYWQHTATTILFPADVPPLGYATYVVSSNRAQQREIESSVFNPRKDKQYEFVLENSMIRAEFAPERLDLVSLVYKPTQEELLAENSGFRLLHEDAGEGMTAWNIGREGKFSRVRADVSNVKCTVTSLRSTLSYKLRLSESSYSVTITLDEDSSDLRVHAEIDYLEQGTAEQTPQLSYALQLKKQQETYLCDAPFGVAQREARELHMPALSWAAASGKDSLLQLVARGTYGFHCSPSMMRLILLRSSSDPDPYPEIGQRTVDFSLLLHKKPASHQELLNLGRVAVTDLQQVTHGAHPGTNTMMHSLMSVEGPVVVTTVKYTEDSRSVVIRLFETEGREGSVYLSLPGSHACCVTDMFETETDKLLSREGEQYVLPLKPNGIYTLRFELDTTVTEDDH